MFKRVCGIGGSMAEKIVAKNKQAYHEYFIEEKYEAGLVLVGTEVKSIRQGKVNLKDSYVSIKNGEPFVYNMHISPYEKGNIYNVDPIRPRKLLLNKREIRKLIGLTTLKGYSLIPLSLYLKNGLVKMELSLAKGKKLYDKRQDLAKKDAERRMQRQGDYR
jgi:SsrA-binding protein